MNYTKIKKEIREWLLLLALVVAVVWLANIARHALTAHGENPDAGWSQDRPL